MPVNKGKIQLDSGQYKLLLISMMGYVLLSPVIITNLHIGRFLYALLFLYIIIKISAKISIRKYTSWILPVLGSIALFTHVTTEHPTTSLPCNIAALAFFSSAIWLFSQNVFANKDHNIDHIYGAICVYMLIGIACATLYMTINILSPGALVHSGSGKYVVDHFDFYYFSFITLSTVGFGDIVSDNTFMKAVILLESITGVFYLAVLVSSLITLTLSDRSS